MQLLVLGWDLQAVLSHLVMKLVLAAPVSFCPSLCVMQASSAIGKRRRSGEAEREGYQGERLDHGANFPN